ncbi:MAG: BamA/TamA family outer membrane protein [Holophagales bacterium]|nr:BamA/TamA family outer membrane protein [Holophagales bacterium]
MYPLDENDQAFFNEQGALLGGDRYLVMNLEAVYYVAGPLKFVLFFDAGNAWLEGQTFNPFKMRASAGVELRMFLPIFQAPLRFIYGINLDPKTIRGQNGVPLAGGQEEAQRLPVLYRDDLLGGHPDRRVPPLPPPRGKAARCARLE